jgi:hypothetical protein
MWRDFLYVLGSAGGYPVGSVTAIPATRLPVPDSFDHSEGIYLVHADLTWDRYGRAIDPPESYQVADIGPHPVGVTLHGQVVYCPFFGSISATDLWN